MAIIKKFNDVALEFGMRISHKVVECKYPSGNIARFYDVNVMKDTHLVQHLEWKIEEVKMTDKQVILKRINSGMKCRKDCFVHSLITHNTCVTCKAFKDSPYHQGFLKDKTDDEIVFEIQEFEKEFGD